MIRAYVSLTKPRIIFGNLITAIGGFALASQGHFDWMVFFALLLGLSCMIGAASTFNNWIDRESDAKMERTKRRPLPTGTIAPFRALIFASILGGAAVFILLGFTNILATSL